jgi:hypothetical protein
MFGSWKHMVWMYNGTSSTYSMFIDGKKLDLPASLAKRYASDPLTGGVGYGIGKFKCFKIHYWRFSATFTPWGALTDGC